MNINLLSLGGLLLLTFQVTFSMKKINLFSKKKTSFTYFNRYCSSNTESNGIVDYKPKYKEDIKRLAIPVIKNFIHDN